MSEIDDIKLDQDSIVAAVSRLMIAAIHGDEDAVGDAVRSLLLDQFPDGQITTEEALRLLTESLGAAGGFFRRLDRERGDLDLAACLERYATNWKRNQIRVVDESLED